MYQALYRQWRPQAFADMVGQEHIARTLQNALEHDRLAHAYLFCGPRGTGKTSAAKILAKAVNCEHGPSREPCNKCAACLGIQAGRNMDVLEIDAASNRGIDDIRELREKVRYAPVEVPYKVYIIDEVHMLSPEAFNALLKTLEEPPARVVFVLATTEPHKLPATIISRCQRLDFHLLGIGGIAERLRQVSGAVGKNITEEAVYLIAEEAGGGMRDALSLLEQVLAYSNGDVGRDDVLAVLGAVGREVFYELGEACLRSDLAAALFLLQDVADGGKDFHHFTQQAIGYFRDLMVVLACGERSGELGIAPDWVQRLKGQAQQLGMGKIAAILAELHGLTAEIRWSGRPRLLWELALFRIIVHGGGYAESESVPVLAEPGRQYESRPQVQQPAVPQATVRQESPAEPDGRQAGCVSEPPTAQSMTRLWPRVMEIIKKESRKTHALLLAGEAVSCEENVLELRFEAQIHCEMMEDPSNKKPLQSVLKKIFGLDFVIRCVKTGEGSGVPREEKDPDELISSAVAIFNGQIIDESGR